MAFRSLAAVLLHVLVVTLPSNARADPIRVTEGALVGDTFFVTLTATGERGLSISTSGDAFGGSYGPSHCSPCLPGDQLNIRSSWSGLDFRGLVSLDGRTFRVGGVTSGSLLADFEGDNVLMPEFAGDTRVSLTRPFSFDGLFFYPESEIPPAEPKHSRGQALPRFSLTGPFRIIPGDSAGPNTSFHLCPSRRPSSWSVSVLPAWVCGGCGSGRHRLQTHPRFNRSRHQSGPCCVGALSSHSGLPEHRLQPLALQPLRGTGSVSVWVIE